MAIIAGQTILAADVIGSSVGVLDANKIPKTNGVGVLDGSFRKVPVVTVYTTPGNYTYNKPLSLCAVLVKVQAAGAGAGSSGASAGNTSSGASAGGFSQKIIPASNLTASAVLTVGAKGTGGSASDGTNGGLSNFSSFILCAGGLKTSRGGPTENPAGGLATGGDLNIQGQDGGEGDVTSGNTSGRGGDSFYGKGGQSSNSTGRNATGYGAGGGGARRSGGEFNGGNGSDGMVEITEIY